jgi:hypothetical protein
MATVAHDRPIPAEVPQVDFVRLHPARVVAAYRASGYEPLWGGVGIVPGRACDPLAALCLVGNHPYGPLFYAEGLASDLAAFEPDSVYAEALGRPRWYTRAFLIGWRGRPAPDGPRAHPLSGLGHADGLAARRSVGRMQDPEGFAAEDSDCDLIYSNSRNSAEQGVP